MNGFRDMFTHVGWVKPVRHWKVKPPISIYGGPTRPARARTRRTSPWVKRLSRLSRRDLRRSFKTYDERAVVGLGARGRTTVSRVPLPSSCPGKIERGRKARHSLDRVLPGAVSRRVLKPSISGRNELLSLHHISDWTWGSPRKLNFRGKNR